MMDLTIDEKMLILLYSPGTRMGLYGALQQMKEQLEEDETELLDLTNSVLQKLSDMDDEAFEKRGIIPVWQERQSIESLPTERTGLLFWRRWLETMISPIRNR